MCLAVCEVGTAPLAYAVLINFVLFFFFLRSRDSMTLDERVVRGACNKFEPIFRNRVESASSIDVRLQSGFTTLIAQAH